MLSECFRAQVDTAVDDTVPMDLSTLGKGGKGEEGQGDKRGKTKARARECVSSSDDRDKVRRGKGKGKNNTTKAEYFAGYCLHFKGWGHMTKDCWWNDGSNSEKDTASLEALNTSLESVTTDPPITGMLL